VPLAESDNVQQPVSACLVGDMLPAVREKHLRIEAVPVPVLRSREVTEVFGVSLGVFVMFGFPFVVMGCSCCCTLATWRTRGSKRKAPFAGTRNTIFLALYPRKKNFVLGGRGLGAREGRALSNLARQRGNRTTAQRSAGLPARRVKYETGLLAQSRKKHGGGAEQSRCPDFARSRIDRSLMGVRAFKRLGPSLPASICVGFPWAWMGVRDELYAREALDMAAKRCCCGPGAVSLPMEQLYTKMLFCNTVVLDAIG
jgi:hypothetical protein